MKTVRSILVTCLIVIFCTALLCAEGTYYPGTNKGYPRRIVSLGPAVTETLFAVGAGSQVVGRTDFCNYPPEASSVASIGGFDGKTFSLETVIALKPDLVCLYTVMHDHLIEPLKKLGIAVYVSDAASVDDVISEITDIGRITGHVSEAGTVTKRITDAVASCSAAVSKNSNKVYWEVWNSPFMSVGNSSFIHDVIVKAGGINIFSDTSEGYPVISEESIIARNPDVIIIPSDMGYTSADIYKRAGWSSVSAVKSRKVFDINSDIASRSGPRIYLAIEQIASLLKD
ncbi:MAG: cobalamin-binding protein [Treponema sp.]|nr:cobalamin-binding protein [Candidatus Treponema caballi]